MTGDSTADESSPLTEPEGMTDPTKTNVLICNLAEDLSEIHTNGPDHMLPAGYYIGKLVSRVVYNSAGDKALYQFHRAFTFECGKLKSVGREFRTTVFTTGPC